MPSTGSRISTEGRSLRTAALLMGGAIVLLTVIAAVVGSRVAWENPDEDKASLPSGQVPAPGIIPLPNSGRAPEEPGERGGWEQLALLGAVVLGVGTVATVLVRNARRAAAAPSTASAASSASVASRVSTGSAPPTPAGSVPGPSD